MRALQDTHTDTHVGTRSLNRSALYSLRSLLSLSSLYLSRCLCSLQPPFKLPWPSGFADCPKVLESRGTVRGFGGQTLGKVSPLLTALGHPGARTGYQESKVRLEGRNLAGGWSQVPGARLPPARTPLGCGRSAQSKSEPMPHPCRSRVLSLPAGHFLPQGLCGRWQRKGGRSGLARGSLAWPRGWLPLCPGFSKLRPPAPARPSPLRCAGGRLTSPCNTWLRGSPGRSFLGAYSLTWEERGTERQKGDRGCGLGAFPPAQPSQGGGQPKRAPRSWRGPGGARQSRGPAPARVSAAPKQCVPAARYYGTAAPRP